MRSKRHHIALDTKSAVVLERIRVERSPIALPIEPGARDLPARLTLGVRPESLSLRDAGTWPAEVTLVEPMGNHQVVWLDASGTSLAALVPDGAALAAGQAVRFDIDPSRVSLFDTAAGHRL